ncbi:hypothetical protein [Nocardioides alcanivorans]|uniref:hypothetical protein n=1 Tax=Nocardioides alcanivorans TaxID=2897352 RepID=UPI001F46AB05|nr:hypothetical protein [Nocardioides alcanivorans]
MSAKQIAARFLPGALVEFLDRLVFNFRRSRIRLARRVAGVFGYNIVKRDDYYSTLPVLEEIEATRARWDKPSELAGLSVDVPALKERLASLADSWEEEFSRTTGNYLANTRKGFGPGYPAFDARTLYYTLREEKAAALSRGGVGAVDLLRVAGGREERGRGFTADDHLHRALPVRGAADAA